MTEEQNGHQEPGRTAEVPEAGQSQEEPVEVQDATVRAQAMFAAQSQSDENLELEFANRVEPVVTELRNRCEELANMGDEAGVAHTRFALDTLIQRFRLPSAEHRSENADFFGQGYLPEQTPAETPPAEGEVQLDERASSETVEEEG